MFNIYTLFPLFFLLISSYYFNKKKIDESMPYLLMVSAFEGIISYFFVYLIFLEGFFTKFYQYLIMFLLIAVISFIFFLIERDLDNDMDLQIETIKNNLILYAITIAPLYIFLTVFRFEGPFLQILYSFLATSAITVIYIFLREPLNYFTESIYLYFAEATANIFLGLWGVVVLVILITFLFDFPFNTIRQQLNLSDNVSYFSFDEFPTNLKNNHRQKKQFQIEVAEELGLSLIDYYLDDDVLYVYSSKDDLYAIDINTEEILHSKKLGIVSEDGTISFNQVNNLFFKVNNQLYILSRSGLHNITPTNFEMISTFKATDTKLFYNDDTPYLLRSIGLREYEIYEVEGNAVILDSTIDANDDLSYDSLTTISQTLFKVSEDTYTNYYHDEYSFNLVNYSPLYDHKNHLMYYTYYEDQIRQTKGTTYIQSISPTEQNIKELYKMHNTYGVIHDGFVFYVESPENSIGRIEIINPDFEMSSILNHRVNSKFWVGQQYYRSYIINYLEIDGNLTYLQTEQNNDSTLLTLEVISQSDTGLDLPFYSFYGLFNYLPILIFLFIPMTNYRTDITFIGFDQILHKNKKQ